MSRVHMSPTMWAVECLTERSTNHPLVCTNWILNTLELKLWNKCTTKSFLHREPQCQVRITPSMTRVCGIIIWLTKSCESLLVMQERTSSNCAVRIVHKILLCNIQYTINIYVLATETRRMKNLIRNDLKNKKTIEMIVSARRTTRIRRCSCYCRGRHSVCFRFHVVASLCQSEMLLLLLLLLSSLFVVIAHKLLVGINDLKLNDFTILSC